MKVEVKGTVYKVLEQSGTSKSTGNSWTKKTVVVKTNSQYDNLIPFEFFNKEVDAVEGQSVTVTGYVGGSEWNGKFYPSLKGDQVSSLSPSSPQPSGMQPNPEFAPPPPPPAPTEEEEDDLPF